MIILMTWIQEIFLVMTAMNSLLNWRRVVTVLIGMIFNVARSYKLTNFVLCFCFRRKEGFYYVNIKEN